MSCCIVSVLITAAYMATYAKGVSGVPLPVILFAITVMPVAGLLFALIVLAKAKRSGARDAAIIGLLLNLLWTGVLSWWWLAMALSR